jgi:transposase
MRRILEVVSDVTGTTGMLIIKAILRGQRDPKMLAKYRHRTCKRTEAEIAKALYGNWRTEHRFALQQAVALYEEYQRQLRHCDEQSAACLRTFADKSHGQPVPPNASCR